MRFPQPLQSANNSQGVNGPVQVGAWGDLNSVGNTGVQVEIQSNAYSLADQAEVAFWVGDVLRDGSFVQLGYVILSPGYYCLTAHITSSGTSCLGAGDNFGSADARWFWAYFPNARVLDDWYYGFGPQNSVGTNGTWHLYSISPSITGDWNFMVDGVMIYQSSFVAAVSSSPAHLVAEKASGPYLSQLGPVEFRDLAYLGNDTLWHSTSSLSPITGCSDGSDVGCDAGFYGVEAAGANDILAGSNLSAPATRQPLWQRQSGCLLNATLASAESVGTAPLNVTFTESVSSPLGSTRTDWWFGDGSHEDGNSTRTMTYTTPGNYTPFVRVLDSAGCLSEASSSVSVAAGSGSTLGTSAGALWLFAVQVFVQWVDVPRNAYAPWQ
jgi:hypothetical protein